MRNLKKTEIVVTLFCLMCILTSCSENAKINPDEYIKTVYPDYEQLTKIEDSTEQMILLKSHDSYELIQFKKKDNTFSYNGGYITNSPYGLKTIKTENKLYINIFIDNTIVKADRFSIQLNASDKEEYITISCPNLLKHDKYIIKSYEMGLEYDEVKPIKFNDKKGNSIPEELIPDL